MLSIIKKIFAKETLTEKIPALDPNRHPKDKKCPKCYKWSSETGFPKSTQRVSENQIIIECRGCGGLSQWKELGDRHIFDKDAGFDF